MNYRTEIVYDMPASEYHSDPCEVPSLTQSIALVLNEESPMHAWQRHPRLGAGMRTATKAMDEGALIDILLLGGDHTKEIAIIDAENFRTKAAQQARDAAREAGLLPVLTSDLADAQRAVDEIRVRFELAGIHLRGRSQVTVFWVEQASNGELVQCRARLDHLDLDGCFDIYDLKKAVTANPKKLARHIEKYGYDIQTAAYLSALAAVMPESIGRAKFKWLFVENEPPFAVSTPEPAGSMLALGRWRWQRAIDTWAACMKSGVFPSYEAQGAVRIEASKWALEDAAYEGMNDNDERAA